MLGGVTIEDVFEIIQAVVPELNEALSLRISIMRELANSTSRVGRKILAGKVYITERALRTAIDSLREQALVDVNNAGIKLTAFGHRTTKAFDEVLTDSNRLIGLEHAVKQHLNIDHCWIVPGDADRDPKVFEAMSHIVQRALMSHLPLGRNVIAVTGGQTLATMGEYFNEDLSLERELIFVPTRGGVGGSILIQSNSVGGLMAQKTQSTYIPLFIPENINMDTSKILLMDPTIKKAIELSQQADCLLLSVGAAEVMAERRDITLKQHEEILEGEAVGEAFGVFYDRHGQEVIRLPRIGIQIEDLERIPLVITVVGGASKADATRAFFKLAPNHGWLICDEGIANQVLKGETL